MRFSQDIYFLLGIRGWWPWRVKIDRKIIYKVLSQSFRVSRPVPLLHAFRVLPYRKCVLPEVCCRLSHNRKKESNRFRYVLVGISSGGHIRISAYTPIYVSFERISLMVIKYSIVVYVEDESNEKQNPHLKRIRRNAYFPSCENWGGGKKGTSENNFTLQPVALGQPAILHLSISDFRSDK